MRATSAQYEFIIRWQPFLLFPDTPPNGVDKPPSTPDKPRIPPLWKKAGKSVGIDFTEKADRIPFTVPCHALLEYAKEKDLKKQNDLAELLFKAYFTDGVYLDANALVKFATMVGLDEAESRKVVEGEDWCDEAHGAATSWKRKGVTALPCFWINGERMFSGAPDKEAFLKIFDMIAERFPCAECAK